MLIVLQTKWGYFSFKNMIHITRQLASFFFLSRFSFKCFTVSVLYIKIKIQAILGRHFPLFSNMFFSAYKLYVTFSVKTRFSHVVGKLYIKTYRKNVMLREHVFIFLKITQQLPLGFIGLSKMWKLQIIELFSSLVFCNQIILGWHIQNKI